MIPRGFAVALVEPRYPVNLGHVARVVKNFGVGKLYLVNPKVDMSVATVYAAHAADVLEGAKVVTFGRLRKSNELLVATTAIMASRGSNVIRRMVRPNQLSSMVRGAKTACLVFGRDTTGLTNEEIASCDVTTAIDTGTGYRTLNVGHAVAILLYLTLRGGGRKVDLQSRVARDLFATSLHDLAAAAGMPDYKVKNLREAGKRIAASSELGDAQLNLMTGVLRKGLLALKQGQRRDSKT